MSTAAREVQPLRELILELKDILEIPEARQHIRLTLVGDIKDAEELANVPKNRPRTKHIATKYHHFRKHVHSGTLLVKRVNTAQKLTDIFTRSLASKILEYLRKQIMGWTAILSHGNISKETFTNMTE